MVETSSILHTFKKLFSLFIFGCAGFSLLCGFFYSCSKKGLLSSFSVWPSHCSGSFGCRAWTLGREGFSTCGSWVLEHRLRSCGRRLVDPRHVGSSRSKDRSHEATPLALAGGFFPTDPPGKPPKHRIVQTSPSPVPWGKACMFCILAIMEEENQFSMVAHCAVLNHSVVPDSLWPHAPTRLLCPWDFSGKNTGVGCHFLLQRIFLTQELNLHLLCLLCCRRIPYPLSHWGSSFQELNVLSSLSSILIVKQISQIWFKSISLFCDTVKSLTSS